MKNIGRIESQRIVQEVAFETGLVVDDVFRVATGLVAADSTPCEPAKATRLVAGGNGTEDT